MLLVGAALQLAGTVATALGVRLVWRDVAVRGETLAGPAATLVRRTVEKVRARVVRLLRPPSPKTGYGSATLTVSSSASGRGYANFRTLPADLASDEAITELDARTREIKARLEKLAMQLADEVNDLKTEAAATTEQLRADIDQQVEHQRRRAVTGIRYEALGLFLISLGFLLTTVSALFAATNT